MSALVSPTVSWNPCTGVGGSVMDSVCVSWYLQHMSSLQDKLKQHKDNGLPHVKGF